MNSNRLVGWLQWKDRSFTPTASGAKSATRSSAVPTGAVSCLPRTSPTATCTLAFIIATKHRLITDRLLILRRMTVLPLLCACSHYDRLVAAAGNSVAFSSSVVKHPSGISKT